MPVTPKVTVWDVLAVIVRLLVEPRVSGIGQTRIPTGHEQVFPLTVNPRVLEFLGICEMLGILPGVVCKAVVPGKIGTLLAGSLAAS